MTERLDTLAIEVEQNLQLYPDFPKPGILFRDIMPIFLKPDLVDRLCKAIADKVRGKIDAVAALEARGFLFGPQVAIDLNVPFIPLRKRGKLPGPLFSAKYVKEYGEDVIEVQANVFMSAQRVLLVDDLLATGGTIGAAIDLVHQTGANVVSTVFVVELTGLQGRTKIPAGISIHSILTYA